MTLVADMPTVSAAQQDNTGPAAPTLYTKSQETDELTAPMPVHDATILSSDELSVQEQQPDPHIRGSTASVQSLLPSATTSFRSCMEG